MGNAPGGSAGEAFERRLREMNEALLVSSVHQQELADEARTAEAAARAHAQELARFNQLAVGRESRVVELKKIINDLSTRLGEGVRYSLDFEDTGSAEPDPSADGQGGLICGAAHSGESPVPLESILNTAELTQRPHRPPDYETESRALASLVRELAESPSAILRVLTQQILEILKADSAGISLLTEDKRRFYWPAIAGAWQPHTGGGTPRDFGPCGDVLDRNAPLLFGHVERRYTYFREISPPVEEALLIPFYVAERAVGTLWAVSHGERRFDAEDLRQLESLGRFASAAYQAGGFREGEQSRHAAALNLMADAVEARDAMERAVGELRASEERYRTLFTSIDEGFCVIEMLFDAQGRPADYVFVETNPGFEKQSGLHGVLGKRMRQLAPNHEAHWFEKYGRVALTGESIRFVNAAHDLGGRWFDVYAFRLGDPERRRVAILFTDITQRVRLEERAREYARSLAELNRRKDEFLAMLSHELRNPLSSLLNAAQLLRRQRDRTPVQIETHQMIDRQVAYLARLVDDLLEVSRISTGRIRLERERLDFRGILQLALESTQPQSRQKEQSVAAVLPDEPVWVNGDSVRLEQIVVNLLNNAVKYTDRGGEIRVGLAVEGAEAVVRIRDNGIGIAPEMLPRIFDLFAQADRSLDRAQGGLGIGLALVQSLVTMQGGRVEAHSELGAGSEFVVRLPALPLPQAPSENSAVSASAPSLSLKVLVVDDNIDAAQSVAMLLQSMGHDARLAHDGRSAMKEALEYLPDIALLDIGLPLVDGFQVAKWIRRQGVLSKVVLVALTGYGRETDRQLSLQAGFNHHLVKPADFAAIESILVTVANTR